MTEMSTAAKASSERRKAYVRRIISNDSVEDIYSDERKEQWELFSDAEKKQIKESKVFIGFVRVSGLSIDSEDHENTEPPVPDILASVEGEAYYFELGEIADQGLAWATSVSVNTGEITGCPFSQTEPLLKMFREKCAKSYLTNGAPVDLLLHFSAQPPYEPLLYEDLKVHAAEIAHLIKGSQYARVWLYSDCRPQKMLWKTIQ